MFPAQFVSSVSAVIIAVIGFYVTTVVEELRSGEVIIYEAKRLPQRIGHSEQTIVFSLSNVSRSKVVKDLSVGVRCKAADKLCFSDDSYEIVYFAPIAGKLEKVSTNRLTTNLSVSLVPGAKVALHRKAEIPNQSDLIVMYFPERLNAQAQSSSLFEVIGLVPKPSGPADTTPVLLKRGSVTALFVEHYFTVMALAMLVSAVLLISMLGYFVLKAFTKKPEDENEAQNLAVSLTYRRGQPSGK